MMKIVIAAMMLAGVILLLVSLQVPEIDASNAGIEAYPPPAYPPPGDNGKRIFLPWLRADQSPAAAGEDSPPPIRFHPSD